MNENCDALRYPGFYCEIWLFFIESQISVIKVTRFPVEYLPIRYFEGFCKSFTIVGKQLMFDFFLIM